MIEINNNKFEDGDEITFLFDDTIIQGEIHIPNDDEYFILHNERSYWYDDNPISNGYKYAWFFRLEDNIDNFIFHRINIKKLFKYTEKHINKSIRYFLMNQSPNLYHLFYLNLEPIEKYEYIRESETQGHIELKSKERNKKLSTKIGRLAGKLVSSFNDIVKTNPKNTLFQFKDKDIERLHNQWMAAHVSEIRYAIFKGEDILKGYTSTNYCKGQGTLHNSCMTDKKHILDLYTKNPDNVSLLVFYAQDEPEKIAGRTLIWKCNDGEFYNDKIYFTQDWFEFAYQNVCNNLGFKRIYGKDDTCSVTLKNLNFKRYPYLDTFYNVSFKRKTLFHNPPDTLKFKYTLRNTMGYIQESYNNNINETEQY